MVSLHRTCCCGLLEVNMLSSEKTPLEALEGMWDFPQVPLKRSPVPFVLFTGVVVNYDSNHARTERKDDYALAFANFITENHLGVVTKSGVKPNCYGGNLLQAWIWEPDHKALKAFMENGNGNSDYTA